MALTGSVEDVGDGRDGSWVGQVAGALDLTAALQLHMTTPAAGFASSAVGQGQSAASCAELESDGSLELSYGEEVRTSRRIQPRARSCRVQPPRACSHLVYVLVGLQPQVL